MIGLDTNVLVRYLVQDDPEIEALFEGELHQLLKRGSL